VVRTDDRRHRGRANELRHYWRRRRPEPRRAPAVGGGDHACGCERLAFHEPDLHPRGRGRQGLRRLPGGSPASTPRPFVVRPGVRCVGQALNDARGCLSLDFGPEIRPASWSQSRLHSRSSCSGVFCGRLATSHYGVIAIELLLGVPVLVAISRRPAVAIVVLLAVVASAFGIRLVAPCEPPGPPADQSRRPAACGSGWRDHLAQAVEELAGAGSALLRGAGTASAPGERSPRSRRRSLATRSRAMHCTNFGTGCNLGVAVDDCARVLGQLVAVLVETSRSASPRSSRLSRSPE